MDDVIMIGPIRFNPRQLEVSRDGKTVRLTPMEGWLLRFLIDHVNTVCSDNQIGSELWGVSDGGETGFIKAYIHHLRYKIEPDPMHPVYILRVPGEGYKLVIPESER